MLQLIGLIVAVYAIVRLCQVPFEHAAYEQTWLKLPFSAPITALFYWHPLG